MAVEDLLTVSQTVVGPMKSVKNGDNGGIEIIDIRQTRAEMSMFDDIKTGLRPDDGSGRHLPTLLLYSTSGLRLFEQITHLKEYYLTNEEIWVLEKYASSIAERLQDGSIIVELGSG